jgi:hypothetical protein
MEHRKIVVDVVAEWSKMLVNAQPAEHVVPRDAEQESTDRAARRIEQMPFAHQEQKNFLRHVLSDIFRPAHLQGKPVNRTLAPAIQHGERLFVSGEHRP